MSKTLFDKIWDAHLIEQISDDTYIFYIDRHFIHEVTSPQAFSGLDRRSLPVLRPQQTVATMDHNVPSSNQDKPIANELSKKQVETLSKNAKRHNIPLYDLQHRFQGIVHIIGPELGITQPGMTIVCGDSHTSTHGALGSIAFGIGTSEVEMVMATQCLLQTKPKRMKISINGELSAGTGAKDVILYVLSKLSVSGATGHFIEYDGSIIKNLTMEGRMTVCNMSIELGGRGGLIAPDETTFSYLKGREFSPKGSAFERALGYYRTLYSDKDADFDKEVSLNGNDIEPMITYGTNPGTGIKISSKIPMKTLFSSKEREGFEKSLAYMNLQEGNSLLGHPIDYVFLGSCTNGRIEDIRQFVSIVKGRKKAKNVTAYLVPGSKQVEKQAYQEGLSDILLDSGFSLRQPSCSACLGMNEDQIPRGKYAISTSNRNFEGRQGPGSRTFLSSPLTAAASAVTGKVTDPREFL